MVIPRQYLKLAVLLLLVTLVLAACERPFPGSGDSATDERTQIVDTGGETTAPLVAGEATETPASIPAPATATPVPAPQEPYPAPAEEEQPATETADTPRVEPEATPVPETAETEQAESEPTAEASPTAEAESEAEAEAAEAPAVSETAETQEETTAAAVANTHTVAAGENLYRIGLKYGISWVTLAEINKISNPNDIKVGQVLQLNGAALPAPEPTPSPHTETTYTVRPGDNLFKIGLAYGINWVQIAEANGIVNPNQIFVGQVLKIPVTAPGPTPQFTHTVQPGETLYLISLQYGVAWPTIAEANKLVSPYVIYAGQTLIIPGGG